MNSSVKLETVDRRVTSLVPARRRWLRRFVRDSRGADFVEYLVLVGVVALAGAAIFGKFKTGLESAGNKAGTTLNSLIP